MNRLRLRRARGHARCLLAALRCWHPFRALRMVRDVMEARLQRLKTGIALVAVIKDYAGSASQQVHLIHRAKGRSAVGR